MTNKELQEFLKKYPDDAELQFSYLDDSYGRIRELIYADEITVDSSIRELVSMITFNSLN